MRATNILASVEKVSLAVFFLSLPVTSFPYLPSALSGAALVRPLSFYPLIILLILAVLPALFREKLPKHYLPLFAFVLAAIVVTLLGFISGIEIASESALFDRALHAFFTLLLGVGIYLTVSLLPKTEKELNQALRWLYGGFAIALAWGSLQIGYVVDFSSDYFQVLNKIQRYISTRKLFHNRVSGFTFEPNWFAEQIVFLLMPWLFASVISSRSIFRWRWRWLTLELILLIWSSFVLVFTYSRAGLFLFIAQLVIAIILKPDKGKTTGRQQAHKNVYLKKIIFVLIVLIIIFGIIFYFGNKNNYFSRLWEYWAIKDQLKQNYFEYIAFSQRFVYWDAAYKIFESRPIAGVGLGYYTFYFGEYFQDRPLYEIPEILRKFTPDIGRNTVVTVKNFFLRLLAETGLVGTAFFLTFILALLFSSVYLLQSKDNTWKYWGRAGLLSLFSFLVITFSFDSFAIPNMWVVFGLITASAHVYERG
ncbi:MAG TPA: hypothetical protein G4N95_05265 [Anaerolineae bacterium]|nr:hypothetical protein [Anaerolineae bacterium]